KVSEFRTEFAPPHDGMTAIAGMAEIDCACHFRYVTAHQIGIPAETAAGEDQRIASNPLPCAIEARNFHARDSSFRIGKKSFGDTSAYTHDVIKFGRGAQSVDQFATGAAWQAMHPQ